MSDMQKLMKKMAKHRALVSGRKQFAPLVRPTAYVFVNNVSVPVVANR